MVVTKCFDRLGALIGSTSGEPGQALGSLLRQTYSARRRTSRVCSVTTLMLLDRLSSLQSRSMAHAATRHGIVRPPLLGPGSVRASFQRAHVHPRPFKWTRVGLSKETANSLVSFHTTASRTQSSSVSYNQPTLAMSTVPHPYYPLGSELDGYVANDWEAGPIFCVFGASITAIIVATRTITERLNPNLTSRDQALATWFVLCKPVSRPQCPHTPGRHRAPRSANGPTIAPRCSRAAHTQPARSTS